MTGSTFSRFIRWYTQRREKLGFKTDDPEYHNFVQALDTGEGHPIGEELYSGKLKSPLAFAIRRQGRRELRNLGTILAYVSDTGYTTLAVRHLLTNHYSRLGQFPIDSEERAVEFDIDSAIEQASEPTKRIARLLAAGYSANELTEYSPSQRSKAVAKAISEITNLLGGSNDSASRTRSSTSSSDVVVADYRQSTV